MSLRRVIILFLAAYVLQLSLAPVLTVRGIMPGLILCLMMTIVFHYNNGYKCLPVALIAALMMDMAAAQYTGPGALVLLLTAGLVIFFRINLNTDNIFPMLVTAACGVVVYDVLYWGILKLLGQPMGFSFMIRQCAGHVLYDLVIVAVLFVIMSRKKPVQVTNDEVEVDGQGIVDPREEKWYDRFLHTGWLKKLAQAMTDGDS